MLAIWLLWDCFEVMSSGEAKWRKSVAATPAWPVFRALGCLVAWHWLWGACLHVWARHRVNVEFLFDADPKDPVSHLDVYAEAAAETALLLALLLAYYKATYAGGLPPPLARGSYVSAAELEALVPCVAVLAALGRLVLPWRRRRHLWACLGRVVAAPARDVRFVDTYVADVLTSMVKVLQDLLWAACFFASGDFRTARKGGAFAPTWAATPFFRRRLVPAACLVPVWFRFAQCLRKYRDVGATPKRWVHCWNAAKYALSLFVSLFTSLNVTSGAGSGSVFVRQPLALVLFLGSSLYSWCWDVRVDWGLRLYDAESREPFSRPSRLFPRRWWYLAAAAADSLGRFVWLATILPPSATSQRIEEVVPDYFVPLLALAELARRCVWSFFRLEHEHVCNAFGNRREHQFVPSHFRRRAVSAAPKRVQSTLEVIFVVALVCFLLGKIALSSTQVARGREEARPTYAPSPAPSARAS